MKIQLRTMNFLNKYLEHPGIHAETGLQGIPITEVPGGFHILVIIPEIRRFLFHGRNAPQPAAGYIDIADHNPDGNIGKQCPRLIRVRGNITENRHETIVIIGIGKTGPGPIRHIKDFTVIDDPE